MTGQARDGVRLVRRAVGVLLTPLVSAAVLAVPVRAGGAVPAGAGRAVAASATLPGDPPAACTGDVSGAVAAWPRVTDSSATPCYLSDVGDVAAYTMAGPTTIFPGSGHAATYEVDTGGAAVPAAWLANWPTVWDTMPVLRSADGVLANETAHDDHAFAIPPTFTTTGCRGPATDAPASPEEATTGRWVTACTLVMTKGPYYGTPGGEAMPWSVLAAAVDPTGASPGALTIVPGDGTSPTTFQGTNQLVELPVFLQPSPYASFTSTSDAIAGTQFTDTTRSDLQIIGWSWDFGDPGSGARNQSTEQNPVHRYTGTGPYTVGLTVTVADGQTDTATAQITAAPDAAPTASFTVTPGATPGTYDLASTSTDPHGDTLDQQWTATDAAAISSVSGGPTTVTYATPGSHTVTLTVTNATGTSATSSATIEVAPPSLSASVAIVGGVTSVASGTAVTAQVTVAASSDGVGHLTSVRFDPSVGQGLAVTSAVALMSVDDGPTPGLPTDLAPGGSVTMTFHLTAGAAGTESLDTKVLATDAAGLDVPSASAHLAVTVTVPATTTTSSTTTTTTAPSTSSSTTTTTTRPTTTTTAPHPPTTPPTQTTTTVPHTTTTTTVPATTVPSATTTTVSSSPPIAPYVPLVPARLLETRAGTGFATTDGQSQGIGTRVPGSVTELVVADRGGVGSFPAAVVLNVAVVDAKGSGFVTVFPCGEQRPNAANLNYATGQTIANAVVTKVGEGGKVCLFTLARVDLAVDVNGWYPSGAAYDAVAPARLLETRVGSGLVTVDGQQQGIGTRPAGSVTELRVTGRGGVSAGASAVVLNVAVIDARGMGFMTVYPCGQPRPNAANLNYATGKTVANAVLAKVGDGGSVCLYTYAAVDLAVDVNGWSPAATDYGPLVPARLLDTRQGPGIATVDGQSQGIGTRLVGSVTELVVNGRGGVPEHATAVVLNVAVIDARGTGYVTVYPCGQPRPNAANLNYVVGETRPNAVVAQVGTGGKVCVYTYAAADLAIDVQGAFPAGP